ncbi:hypothetical protein Ddye_001976 [Dipteronia dyeriana]|uniref:DUF8040 domain-containing protein n=1 Tax=Dipteronia dyeriana TaxID=168575 RepID=A0AAE0CTZ9_9ROSI|nr:hypothetical protein Ddye_001976 [Dipteronia dyeriana]
MISVAILMVLLKVDFAQQQYKRNMLRRCTFANNQTRLFYLDSLIGSSNMNCVNQLRMDRRTFGILCELLRTDDKLKKDGLVTIEEQMCSFLHVLAHHLKNRTIGHRFNRSGETVSRYFNFVLNGIVRCKDIYYKSRISFLILHQCKMEMVQGCYYLVNAGYTNG